MKQELIDALKLIRNSGYTIDQLIEQTKESEVWIPKFIDQPVYVRDSDIKTWILRFIADTKLDSDGSLICWYDGRTSKATIKKTSWEYWKPAEDYVTQQNWLPNTGVMPECKKCLVLFANGSIGSYTDPAMYDWEITDLIIAYAIVEV